MNYEEIKESKKYPLDTASALIWLIGSALGHTWRPRWSISGKVDPRLDPGTGTINCFWHSHILSFSFELRKTGRTAVVSESGDGRRAAAVASRWHHGIIAGSSSKSGLSALRSCVRVLRDGGNVVITPDGPRGPREIVKPGIAKIALITGLPVVPMTACPAKYWRLKSWDRFVIPKPFTRLHLQVGKEIDPRAFSSRPDPEASLTRHIQHALRDISHVA